MTDLDALRVELEGMLPCPHEYAPCTGKDNDPICTLCRIRPAVLAFVQRKLEEKDAAARAQEERAIRLYNDLSQRTDKAEAALAAMTEQRDAYQENATIWCREYKELEDEHCVTEADLAAGREELHITEECFWGLAGNFDVVVKQLYAAREKIASLKGESMNAECEARLREYAATAKATFAGASAQIADDILALLDEPRFDSRWPGARDVLIRELREENERLREEIARLKGGR